MGSTKIAAPPPRDYGEDMASTLRAQAEAMGGTGRFSDIGPMVDLEAEQRPKWTNLELQTLRDTLQGTADAPGLLSMYKDQVLPSLNESEAASNRYRRLQDLADVSAFGESATNAFLDADPMKRQASDMLLQGAINDYSLGAKLDPSLAREVQQGYRNAATARGIAHSPFSAAEESYWQGLQANQLKQQRQAALSQLLGQRQAMVGDPFMQVLGRQGQAFGAAQGYGAQGMGMGQALGPRIYQPESQMAQDIFGGNQQTALAVSQANAANSNAFKTGLMSMGGSILGGMATGGTGFFKS